MRVVPTASGSRFKMRAWSESIRQSQIVNQTFGRKFDDIISAMSNIHLGTSAFTAAGWEGSFYPEGMKPAPLRRPRGCHRRIVSETLCAEEQVAP